MSVLSVPKILRERLTDDGVDEFIAIIKSIEDDARRDSLAIAEERFEKRLIEETSRLDKRITEEASRLDKRITEEASRLDKRITEEISKLRVEMVEKFAQLETKMETKIAQLETKITSFKAEIIKWMFLFWVGQLMVVAGLIKWLR